MNELTGSKDFTAYNERYQKYLPTVPLEFAKNFQKKRIDHRHHAMDALVIACATRDHVNFLNNQHALDKKKTKEEKDKSRFDLRNKLCFKNKGDDKGNYNWQFFKPWGNFTVDARNELEKIIVSFKQNLRVINKSVNYYQRFVDGKKVIDKQTGGENWAIRKPLHKDTVSGLVRLRKTKTVSLNAALDNYLDIVDKSLRKHIISLVSQNYDKKKLVRYFKERENQWNGIDITKVAIYYWENDNVASRVSLDTSFNEKRIIETITDTGIQMILLNHLENYKGRLDDQGKEIVPESLAFTPEGIDEMNKISFCSTMVNSISQFLKSEPMNPKVINSMSDMLAIKTKYVEAAKGTNLFFAIYVDDEGKRSYETIPLNIVIERLKQGLKEVPERNEKGIIFYFLYLRMIWCMCRGKKS